MRFTKRQVKDQVDEAVASHVAAIESKDREVRRGRLLWFAVGFLTAGVMNNVLYASGVLDLAVNYAFGVY